MYKQTLIDMLILASENTHQKRIKDLADQISVDPKLGDTVEIDNFNNEEYAVRDVTRIKLCFWFKLI